MVGITKLVEAQPGNKNRLCVSARARTLSPPTLRFLLPPRPRPRRHLVAAFIERRSITVLLRTIPFGTVRISFFSSRTRAQNPRQKLSYSSLSSRKSCMNSRPRVARIWELIQTALLQCDPFSLFRRAFRYYAIIYLGRGLVNGSILVKCYPFNG